MLRVAIIQPELIWESPEANRAFFQNKIKELKGKTDLVVLPEMFTTGFTMNATNVAETPEGPTLKWLLNLANECNLAITGSFVVSDGDHFFNRLLFVLPDQTFYAYDKRHLFSYAGEDKVFTAGKDKLIVEYKNWRICPLICYDLRFPVFSRNVEHYDLLLYVANWPTIRIEAWDALLRARAIENMAYVVGVNRIGTDGNNHHYCGHSQVVDFLGKYVIPPSEDEAVPTATLSKTELQQTRNKLRFLDDRDQFTLN